jgi:hypothetical protein
MTRRPGFPGRLDFQSGKPTPKAVAPLGRQSQLLSN